MSEFGMTPRAILVPVIVACAATLAAHAGLAVIAAVPLVALWIWVVRGEQLRVRQLRERYGLSVDGFVCGAQASPLPGKFAAWESIAMHLPELNRTGRLRAEIDAMPLIAIAPGDLDKAALSRTRVILTYFVHSYVFGHLMPWQGLRPLEGGGSSRRGCHPTTKWVYAPTQDEDHATGPDHRADAHRMSAGGAGTSSAAGLPRLPTQLATPWRQVSALLGMPLVLCVTDTDLFNHAPFERGVRAREWVPRFTQLVSMTATRSERGFHAVPHAINRTLAPLVLDLVAAPEHVRTGATAPLVRLCRSLADALDCARSQLAKIYTEVEPTEFFDFFRFLLGGFPDGLHLPASPEHALPEDVVHHVGPSAGQTAVLVLVDLVLGIAHGPQLAPFQQQMRSYMPACHAQLLKDVESAMKRAGTLHGAATAADAPSALAQAYDGACRALAALRALHLGVATHFLRKALKGTGGTDFRALLDEGLMSTRRAMGCTAVVLTRR